MFLGVGGGGGVHPNSVTLDKPTFPLPILFKGFGVCSHCSRVFTGSQVLLVLIFYDVGFYYEQSPRELQNPPSLKKLKGESSLSCT